MFAQAFIISITGLSRQLPVEYINWDIQQSLLRCDWLAFLIVFGLLDIFPTVAAKIASSEHRVLYSLFSVGIRGVLPTPVQFIIKSST